MKQTKDSKAPNGTSARIGVYVCRCGLNIAQTVDCDKVAEDAKGLEDVVVSKDIPYACSEPGQMEIREDIEEHREDLDIAAAQYQALGLLDPDVDIVETLERYLSTGTAGVYRPDTKEMVVRGRLVVLVAK